jgi:hypothetical protein
MNHLIRAAAVALLCAVAPASAFAASKTFDVAPFTAIEITSGINARVTVGGALAVAAEARDQDQLDELKIDVSGGRLKAYVDWNLLGFLAPDRQIKLTITVPSLDTVDSSSGADVEVTGLAGDLVTLRASSGSDVNAERLLCADVEAIASSGSDLDVHATASIKAEASSGSDLTVTGNPVTREEDESSGADLRID